MYLGLLGEELNGRREQTSASFLTLPIFDSPILLKILPEQNYYARSKASIYLIFISLMHIKLGY